jgi:hypothetical protein
MSTAREAFSEMRKENTPLDIPSFRRYRVLFEKGSPSCKTWQADTIFISAIIFIMPVCLRCAENLTKEFQNRWRDKRRGFFVYTGRGGTNAPRPFLFGPVVQQCRKKSYP